MRSFFYHLSFLTFSMGCVGSWQQFLPLNYQSAHCQQRSAEHTIHVNLNPTIQLSFELHSMELWHLTLCQKFPVRSFWFLWISFNLSNKVWVVRASRSFLNCSSYLIICSLFFSIISLKFLMDLHLFCSQCSSISLLFNSSLKFQTYSQLAGFFQSLRKSICGSLLYSIQSIKGSAFWMKLSQSQEALTIILSQSSSMQYSLQYFCLSSSKLLVTFSANLPQSRPLQLSTLFLVLPSSINLTFT